MDVAEPRHRDLHGRHRATELRESEMEGATRRELASTSSLSFTSAGPPKPYPDLPCTRRRRPPPLRLLVDHQRCCEGAARVGSSKAAGKEAREVEKKMVSLLYVSRLAPS
jgi:hypothetical protein